MTEREPLERRFKEIAKLGHDAEHEAEQGVVADASRGHAECEAKADRHGHAGGEPGGTAFDALLGADFRPDFMFAEAHTEEIGHRVRARRRTDEQQLLVNGKIQGGHDQHGNVQQPPGEHRDPRKAVLVVVRPAEQEHAGEDQRGQGEGHDDHFGAHPCGGDEQAAERKAEDTPADVALSGQNMA